MKYDVIVCGSGIQGLWTANHLAEKKYSTLLLEQFPFPHTRGSSHGQSRITRYSYQTSHHAEMMIDAFKFWNYLENHQNTKLFENSGLLSIGPDDSIRKLEKQLSAVRNDFKKLKSSEVDQKFPGLSSQGFCAIYEGTAGILKASKCVEALHKNLTSLGGKMLAETKVESIEPVSDELVKVFTNNGIYLAKSVVLTCGPWINDVLKPLNLSIPVQPLKVSVEYWQAINPKLYDVNNFPAVIISDPVMSSDVYSLPISEYPGLMKVCLHGGVKASPDKPFQYDEKYENSLRNSLKSTISRFYPGLVPNCALQETCFYSQTPDADFILDYHPQHKNVVIGAGFSGHGFKLSPVIGKILADLAVGNTSKYDMKPFKLKRFNLLKSSL